MVLMREISHFHAIFGSFMQRFVGAERVPFFEPLIHTDEC